MQWFIVGRLSLRSAYLFLRSTFLLPLEQEINLCEGGLQWNTLPKESCVKELSNSMCQCHFLKASSCSSSPDIFHFVWNFQGHYLIHSTRWRSWLRYCATSRKVAGSIPDGIIGIFHWHNRSGCPLALGLTKSLTEINTRNISWGVKAAGA